MPAGWGWAEYQRGGWCKMRDGTFFLVASWHDGSMDKSAGHPDWQRDFVNLVTEPHFGWKGKLTPKSSWVVVFPSPFSSPPYVHIHTHTHIHAHTWTHTYTHKWRKKWDNSNDCISRLSFKRSEYISLINYQNLDMRINLAFKKRRHWLLFFLWEENCPVWLPFTQHPKVTLILWSLCLHLLSPRLGGYRSCLIYGVLAIKPKASCSGNHSTQWVLSQLWQWLLERNYYNCKL